MILYYLDDDSVIRERNLGDLNIANQEQFNREMDELYPNGWSFNIGDLAPQDDEQTDEEHFDDMIDNDPDNIDAYLHEEDCENR